MTKRTQRSLISVLALILLATGCSSPADWYPNGTVEVLTFYEGDDELGRYCAVSYRISNTGKTEIISSTVSIRLETDAHPYYLTVVDERNVLPGGTITGTVEFEYQTPEERTAADKVIIEDSFFR